MSALDHTIIYFHNGKLMKHKDDIIGPFYLPFRYDMDAKLYDVEYDKRRRYLSMAVNDDEIDKVNNCLEYGLNDSDLEYYSYYSKDDIEIITYESRQCNIIIYVDDDNSYILLGGYGHYMNPYTHFYERGYGIDFERTMARECYFWIMEDVIDDMASSLNDDYETIYEFKDRIRRKLGHKVYNVSSEEERYRYYENDKIEVEYV